jgi:hypothetical protein
MAEEMADVLICLDLLAMSEGIDLGAATVAKFNATSEKYGLSIKLRHSRPALPSVEALAKAMMQCSEADEEVFWHACKYGTENAFKVAAAMILAVLYTDKQVYIPQVRAKYARTFRNVGKPCKTKAAAVKRLAGETFHEARVVSTDADPFGSYCPIIAVVMEMKSVLYHLGE